MSKIERNEKLNEHFLYSQSLTKYIKNKKDSSLPLIKTIKNQLHHSKKEPKKCLKEINDVLKISNEKENVDLTNFSFENNDYFEDETDLVNNLPDFIQFDQTKKDKGKLFEYKIMKREKHFEVLKKYEKIISLNEKRIQNHVKKLNERANAKILSQTEKIEFFIENLNIESYKNWPDETLLSFRNNMISKFKQIEYIFEQDLKRKIKSFNNDYKQILNEMMKELSEIGFVLSDVLKDLNEEYQSRLAHHLNSINCIKENYLINFKTNNTNQFKKLDHQLYIFIKFWKFSNIIKEFEKIWFSLTEVEIRSSTELKKNIFIFEEEVKKIGNNILKVMSDFFAQNEDYEKNNFDQLLDLLNIELENGEESNIACLQNIKQNFKDIEDKINLKISIFKSRLNELKYFDDQSKSLDFLKSKIDESKISIKNNSEYLEIEEAEISSLNGPFLTQNENKHSIFTKSENKSFQNDSFYDSKIIIKSFSDLSIQDIFDSVYLTKDLKDTLVLYFINFEKSQFFCFDQVNIFFEKIKKKTNQILDEFNEKTKKIIFQRYLNVRIFIQMFSSFFQIDLIINEKFKKIQKEFSLKKAKIEDENFDTIKVLEKKLSQETKELVSSENEKSLEQNLNRCIATINSLDLEFFNFQKRIVSIMSERLIPEKKLIQELKDILFVLFKIYKKNEIEIFVDETIEKVLLKELENENDQKSNENKKKQIKKDLQKIYEKVILEKKENLIENFSAFQENTILNFYKIFKEALANLPKEKQNLEGKNKDIEMILNQMQIEKKINTHEQTENPSNENESDFSKGNDNQFFKILKFWEMGKILNQNFCQINSKINFFFQKENPEKIEETKKVEIKDENQIQEENIENSAFNTLINNAINEDNTNHFSLENMKKENDIQIFNNDSKVKNRFQEYFDFISYFLNRGIKFDDLKIETEIKIYPFELKFPKLEAFFLEEEKQINSIISNSLQVKSSESNIRKDSVKRLSNIAIKQLTKKITGVENEEYSETSNLNLNYSQNEIIDQNSKSIILKKENLKQKDKKKKGLEKCIIDDPLKFYEFYDKLIENENSIMKLSIKINEIVLFSEDEIKFNLQKVERFILKYFEEKVENRLMNLFLGINKLRLASEKLLAHKKSKLEETKSKLENKKYLLRKEELKNKNQKIESINRNFSNKIKLNANNFEKIQNMILNELQSLKNSQHFFENKILEIKIEPSNLDQIVFIKNDINDFKEEIEMKKIKLFNDLKNSCQKKIVEHFNQFKLKIINFSKDNKKLKISISQKKELIKELKSKMKTCNKMIKANKKIYKNFEEEFNSKYNFFFEGLNDLLIEKRESIEALYSIGDIFSKPKLRIENFFITEKMKINETHLILKNLINEIQKLTNIQAKNKKKTIIKKEIIPSDFEIFCKSKDSTTQIEKMIDLDFMEEQHQSINKNINSNSSKTLESNQEESKSSQTLDNNCLNNLQYKEINKCQIIFDHFFDFSEKNSFLFKSNIINQIDLKNIFFQLKIAIVHFSFYLEIIDPSEIKFWNFNENETIKIKSIDFSIVDEQMRQSFIPNNIKLPNFEIINNIRKSFMLFIGSFYNENKQFEMDINEKIILLENILHQEIKLIYKEKHVNLLNKESGLTPILEKQIKNLKQEFDNIKVFYKKIILNNLETLKNNWNEIIKFIILNKFEKNIVEMNQSQEIFENELNCMKNELNKKIEWFRKNFRNNLKHPENKEKYDQFKNDLKEWNNNITKNLETIFFERKKNLLKYFKDETFSSIKDFFFYLKFISEFPKENIVSINENENFVKKQPNLKKLLISEKLKGNNFEKKYSTENLKKLYSIEETDLENFRKELEEPKKIKKKQKNDTESKSELYEMNFFESEEEFSIFCVAPKKKINGFIQKSWRKLMNSQNELFEIVNSLSENKIKLLYDKFKKFEIIQLKTFNK